MKIICVVPLQISPFPVLVQSLITSSEEEDIRKNQQEYFNRRYFHTRTKKLVVIYKPEFAVNIYSKLMTVIFKINKLVLRLNELNKPLQKLL